MKYATKKDIIDKYASRRKALVEEDVEDLLEATIGYITKELRASRDKGEFSYDLEYFGQFYEHEFDTRDLIKEFRTEERAKADNKLHEFILTGIVRPKKITIKDDKLFRI